MLRRFAPVTVAAMLCLAVLLPTVPEAAAQQGNPNRWTKLGVTTANFSQPGMARTVNDADLHVVWAAPNSVDGATTDLLHTRIAPDGAIALTEPIVTGWNFIWPVPDLVANPTDGGFLALWGGVRSTDPNEKLTNISAAMMHPVGTSSLWNLQDQSASEGTGASASSVGAAMPTDYESLFSWSGTAGVFVHQGIDRSTPNYDYQAQFGGCCGYSPDLASRGVNGAWIAWYSNATGYKGVWAQGVDVATGAPVGTATRMPGSSTVFQGEEQSIQQITRTPIAAGGSDLNQNTYVAYTGGYPAPKKMLVWTINSAGVPAADSFVAGKGDAVHAPAIATDSLGHAWVVWSEGTTGTSRIFARRSNVGGTGWGQTVAVALPKDGSGCQTVYGITPQTVDGNVDIIATISEGCTSGVALWHTTIEPGLYLSAHPLKFQGKEKVTFTVSDAGLAVPGAKVTVDGKSAITDANGQARIVLGPYAKDQKLVAKATMNGFVSDKVTLHAQN